MSKKVIITILLLSIIHFCLTMLALANGFIIFRGPSTANEIFWASLMNVLLFPANILPLGSGTQWEQTLAIVLNSFIWGMVFTALYLGLKKLLKKKLY